jgi:hypothetical protein
MTRKVMGAILGDCWGFNISDSSRMYICTWGHKIASEKHRWADSDIVNEVKRKCFSGTACIRLAEEGFLRLGCATTILNIWFVV